MFKFLKDFNNLVKFYQRERAAMLKQPTTVEEELHYPDLCPQSFDVNYKAYLVRISRWGKVRIKHSLFKTVEVTEEQFLEYMRDDRNFNGFPVFVNNNTGTLTWEMEREIPVPDGKFVTEKFSFEITKLALQEQDGRGTVI